MAAEDFEPDIPEPPSIQTTPITETSESLKAPIGSRQLHMAVWLADAPRVKELLEADANVNAVDDRGATPLMLAVELLPRAREYEDVLHKLLEFEADPRARSAVGWSPLEEAASRGDERLVKTLFECTQHNLKLRWQDRLNAVVRSLQVLPDFECRIRWEFESPVLPLFNKIAPSDVLRLRKQGVSLRLDSTLASWKRFRLAKRRELTTLFSGEMGDAEQPTGTSSSSSAGVKRAAPSLHQLNHTKKVVTDVTEGLDTEEAGAVVNDMVAGEAVQWDMKVDNLEVSEATTWLGQLAPPVEVNGWQATRFDVKGSLGVTVRKKGSRRNNATFEDYFGCPLPADACLPEFRQEFGGAQSPCKFARENSENSRGSNWSEYTEGSGWHAQKQIDYIFPTDIDEVSTCSEVIDRWPDSSALPFNDTTSKMDGSGRRVDCDGRPGRPGGDMGPSPNAMRKRIQGDISETSSNCSGTSATSSTGLLSGRKGSFFSRSSKKEVGDKVGKTSHRVSASVWVANSFPIPLQQFLPILETLSTEHEAMRRLKELLDSQGLKDAFERARTAAEASEGSGSTGHIFPVKVTVPLNLAVRGTVHFEAFEIRSPGTFSKDIFQVPAGYTHELRKQASKTLNRSRKRMLLAQMSM
jgi:hypothetical protein